LDTIEESQPFLFFIMNIEITDVDGSPIAEIISPHVVISNAQDALEIMANCSYQGAGKIIVHEHQLAPDFFDLKSGIAGEVLQKFSNYRNLLAIVGDFEKYEGKSLRDFIYESNKMGRISFVGTVNEARERLAKKDG
jgi:hypothetical protein